jgi:hypothetical protein
MLNSYYSPYWSTNDSRLWNFYMLLVTQRREEITHKRRHLSVRPKKQICGICLGALRLERWSLSACNQYLYIMECFYSLSLSPSLSLKKCRRSLPFLQLILQYFIHILRWADNVTDNVLDAELSSLLVTFAVVS